MPEMQFCREDGPAEDGSSGRGYLFSLSPRPLPQLPAPHSKKVERELRTGELTLEVGSALPRAVVFELREVGSAYKKSRRTFRKTRTLHHQRVEHQAPL